MWCESVEARLGPFQIVVGSTVFNDFTGMSITGEEMFIQAFIPQPAIEALHKAILHRLSGHDVVPFDLTLLLPLQHGVGGQFRSTGKQATP